MGVKNPWAKHYQAVWEDRAADTTLPLWLRMTCIAYGRHEANGHANFRRGQLSWILGKMTEELSWKRVDRAQLTKAITVAVRHGWLAAGSCSECLIVPGHAVGGPLGNPDKPCAVHERKTKRSRPQLRAVT